MTEQQGVDETVDNKHRGPGYSPLGRLDWPTDVERLPDGNTLITDAGYWSGQGSEILEVDRLGNIVWTYNTGLRFAHSAKLLPQGTILIADTSNDRLIEVTRDGIIAFDSQEWGNGTGTMSDGSHLRYPNDAHLLDSGDFLITDRNNNRVIVVDRRGNTLKQWSNLKHPHNGHLLPNGNLLVANSDANLVQEIDLAGNVVWSYGDGATSVLNWPRDADRLSNGNTLITDSKNHRVIEVNPKGKVVWTYQMTKRGHLYDADRLPNGNTLISAQQRFQVFEVDPAGNIVWSFRNYYRPEPLPDKLQNPGFEEEAYRGAGYPAGWAKCDLVSEGGASFHWDSEVYYRGNRSVSIEYANLGAVWWQQSVQVKGNCTYQVTGHIRTQDLHGACQMQVAFLDEEGCFLQEIRDLPGGKQFNGTTDWTRDTFDFRTPPEARAMDIRLLVVGKGRVWFDEIDLTRLLWA